MNQYVAFSGGKDSTALALLMPDAIPVFTDTGWEFDELYQHIERFESVTGREVLRIARDESLPEYIRRSRFMPGHASRFCTRMFKIEPLNEFLKDQLPATLNIALRADEPADVRVGNLTEMEGLTIAYPLREWGYALAEVLKTCLEHDLLPRAYPYMARGGCKGCFYKRREEVEAMIHLVPEVIDQLQELEEDVQDRRGVYAQMFPNAGMSISDMRLQPLLFDVEEVYRKAADKSDVGPNCGLFCNR